MALERLKRDADASEASTAAWSPEDVYNETESLRDRWV